MRTDSRHSPRATAIAIAAVFFVNGTMFSSWLPRLPELQQRLGISDAALGLTLVGGGLGGLTVSLFSGKVVDRFGSKRTTVATSVGLACLLPCVAVAGSAPTLFTALIVLGALDGLTDVAMNSQAVDLQHATGRTIISRMHALWSTGAVVGGIVSSRAASAGVDLRAQLVATAVITATVTLVVSRWLLTGPRPFVAPDAAEAVVEGPSRQALFVRLFLVGTAVALTELPLNDWSALMMADRFDLTAGQAGLGFVAFATGMLTGRVLGDATSDRFGLERTRRGGAAIALVGVIGATTLPSAVAAGASLVVAGLGVAALFPLMFRTASELTHGSSGGMAAFSSGARLGILVSSPLVGLIAEQASVAVGVLVVSGFGALVVATSSLPTAAARAIAPTVDVA